MGVVRTTYLIDENGMIIKAFSKVKASENPQQMLNELWGNGILHGKHCERSDVVSAFFTASIISGEPRIDEESFELRFFSREEMPPLFAEDHIAAMEAYTQGVRYPLLRENIYQPDAAESE